MKKFFATVLALCMSLCIFAVPSSAEKHVRSDDGAVVVCNCQSKNKTRARKQSSLLRVIGESIKWAGIDSSGLRRRFGIHMLPRR